MISGVLASGVREEELPLLTDLLWDALPLMQRTCSGNLMQGGWGQRGAAFLCRKRREGPGCSAPPLSYMSNHQPQPKPTQIKPSHPNTIESNRPGFCQKLLDKATLLDRRVDAARVGTQFGALLGEAGAWDCMWRG
jgi:hypothetical protein